MTIDNYKFAGKKAIVRVDFNVPLDENGKITDDTRIRGALPTLKKILADGGALIIMSHMGKPKGKVNPKFSLSQIVDAVSEKLGVAVKFAPDCAKATDAAAALQPGEVLLLENLRFYPEEEGKPVGIDKEDPAYEDAKKAMKASQKEFAKTLASYADCYVNDAFGTAHRKHASTAVIADYFDADNKMLGYLMEKEVNAVDNVLSNIKRPFTAIMGGSKVSTKIGIIENLMDKVDNLILCGGDGRIIDCMRRVDFEMSQQRQVLPGLYYHLPPRQEKRSPLEVEEQEFRTLLESASPEIQTDKWLLDTFTAIAPLWAREMAFRAGGSTDCLLSAAVGRLWLEFDAWRRLVRQGEFLPVVLARDGKPFDFTFAPVLQYENACEIRTEESFSQLLDHFYAQREQADRVRQKGQDLLKTAINARDRLRRKLSMQAQEYEKTRDRDALRISGELITANLYRMERGMARLEAENYYEEGCPRRVIPLDVRLSPQENAAKYFKRYNKAKTAEKMLAQLMAQGREELAYLESVLQEIQQAESEQDFNDIRAELTEGGYIRSHGRRQPGFQRKSEPRHFRTDAGLLVLVGRSNRQNDKLTGKTADRTDWWFHTQKIHGSHVILCTNGVEPDEGSILQAAQLAAYYSQGRDGSKVAVDYTPIKYVKKPAGARPGMVIYTTYRTILAQPDGELVQRLAVK